MTRKSTKLWKRLPRAVSKTLSTENTEYHPIDAASMTDFSAIDSKIKELQDEVNSQAQKNPMAKLYTARRLERLVRGIQEPAVTYAKQRLFVSTNHVILYTCSNRVVR